MYAEKAMRKSSVLTEESVNGLQVGCIYIPPGKGGPFGPPILFGKSLLWKSCILAWSAYTDGCHFIKS